MALRRGVYRAGGLPGRVVQASEQFLGLLLHPTGFVGWLLDNNEGLQCVLSQASVCNLYSYWDRGGATWDSRGMGSSETR